MSRRMQTTEGGFILEGEINTLAPPTPPSGGSSVERAGGAEPLQRTLLDGLAEFRGQRVRITVEVLQHSPTDRLRDLIERFREESDEQQPSSSAP